MVEPGHLDGIETPTDLGRGCLVLCHGPQYVAAKANNPSRRRKPRESAWGIPNLRMAFASIETTRVGELVPDTEDLRPSTAATALVAADLLRVDKRILELVHSEVAMLRQISEELVLAGGKRVRPALILLVHHAAGGNAPGDAIDVGAALELIHSATLLHDDILDKSGTRRGQPSALARHGEAFTLVTGDFLFSRAFSVAGRFEAKVVGWAAEACVQLCEGEILQQQNRRCATATIDTWEAIASRKTASLFSQAARIGAHFAKADDALVESMRLLGFEVGIVFQMIDDLVDITGPEALIGKPVGGDLREGTPALPIVLGLATLAPVREAFLAAAATEAQVSAALAALLASTIPEQIRTMARERVARARSELHRLPKNAYRDALEDLLDMLLSRAA